MAESDRTQVSLGRKHILFDEGDLKGMDKIPQFTELLKKLNEELAQGHTNIKLSKEDFELFSKGVNLYNEDLQSSIESLTTSLSEMTKGFNATREAKSSLKGLVDIATKLNELTFKEGGANLKEYINIVESAGLKLSKLKQAEASILKEYGGDRGTAMDRLASEAQSIDFRTRIIAQRKLAIIKGDPGADHSDAVQKAEELYGQAQYEKEAKELGMKQTIGASSLVGGLAGILGKIPGLEGESEKLRTKLHLVQEEAGKTEMSFAEAQKATLGILKSLDLSVVFLTLGAIAAKQIWSAFQKVSEAAVNFKREVGGTLWSAEWSATFNKGLVTGVNWLETATGLAKDLGMNLNLGGKNNLFSDQSIADVAQAKLMMGLSADEANNLAIRSKLAGQSAGTWRDNMAAGANESNRAHKSIISLGAVQRELLSVSDATALSYGNDAKNLAAAAVAAKDLGMSLNEMEGVSKNLMNFESSISAEMEAQLMTGRHLNLEKAREDALNNNLKGVADDILAQGVKAADFTHMNYLQQESLAKAVGMTRDQLAKSLILRQLNNGVSAEALAAATNMKKEDLEAMKATEMWHEAVQKLAQSFAPILEQVSNILRILAKGLAWFTSSAWGKGIGILVGGLASVLFVGRAVVGIIAAIAKGIGGLATAGKAGGFGGVVKKLFRVGGAGKAAAAASVADKVKNLEGGIPKNKAMTRGAGAGIVGFFKAFATAGPTILLGAAYIAGIVAILGGGVAAAISLVALSLKLFAWSMKSLASVEWKKLSGVGSILGGLALGIGALVLGSFGGIGLVTAAVGLMALAVPLAIIARSSRAGDTFVKLAAGVTTLKSALKDFPLKEFKGVGSILGGLALGIGALVLGSFGGIGLVTAAVGLMALAVPLAIIARSSRAGDTFVKLAAGVTTLKSALKDFPLKEFKGVGSILGGLALGIGALVLGSFGGIGLVTAAVGLMALAVPLAIIARSSRAGDT